MRAGHPLATKRLLYETKLEPLWEQSPFLLLDRDFLHAKRQSRCPHAHLLLLRKRSHPAEGIEHKIPQLLVDLLLAPHELLEVLHPFEVAHRHTTGIAEHVRDDE